MARKNKGIKIGLLYNQFRQQLPDARVAREGITVHVSFHQVEMFDSSGHISAYGMASLIAISNVLKNFGDVGLFVSTVYSSSSKGGDSNFVCKSEEKLRQFLIDNGVSEDRILSTNIIGTEVQQESNAPESAEIICYELKSSPSAVQSKT